MTTPRGRRESEARDDSVHCQHGTLRACSVPISRLFARELRRLGADSSRHGGQAEDEPSEIRDLRGAPHRRAWMDLSKSVMKPSSLDLGRDVVCFVLVMEFEESVHLGGDLFRRTILIHASICSRRIVRKPFVLTV